MTITTKTQDGARATTQASARQPFDFGLSLRFIERFPAMTGEQGVGDGAVTHALRAGGITVGARISADNAGLRYELESADEISDSVVAEVVDRLTFCLGLDDDVAAFYALAARDPPFQRVIERLRGYHQVKFPSPLELLCWAILGQRIPMPVARKMKHAIMVETANRITVGGREMLAFPDLAQLVTLTQEDLEGLIGNRRKALYLHGAFQHWLDIDESFLRTGEHEDVRERLLAIPGVGPWSATLLMVRGLGRTEKIGPDREGKLAAGRVYGRAVSDADFVALAERYDGWEGYWGHYLRVGG